MAHGPCRLSVADMLATLGPGAYSRPVTLGRATVELFAPDRIDRQTPHEADEFYLLVSGSGTLVRGSERIPAGTGDLLFVPAGASHRFVDFTSDFTLWVILVPAGEAADDGRPPGGAGQCSTR